MDVKVVAQVLRRAEVLGELGEPFRAEVAALARSVRQPAGAYLFHQDDPPDALYVVSTGLLRVVVAAPDGTETTLETLGPGSVFGELALLDGRPRSASVVAVTDCLLLRVPRLPFLALVRARPELALALIRGLAGRVRKLSRHVEEGSTLFGRARLIRHLLRLAELRGVEQEDGVAIDEHLPQVVLASSLGLSRQTVNRLLQELQSEGLVTVRRARILLRDPVRLAGLDGAAGGISDDSG